MTQSSLDEIAEKIRHSTNYYERQKAIAEFKRACPPTLNPALEAVNRSVLLSNPLSPVTHP